MRYVVQVQMEHESVPLADGTAWAGSIGLPTFYVDAINPDNAKTIALDVVRPRANETAHISLGEAEGN